MVCPAPLERMNVVLRERRRIGSGLRGALVVAFSRNESSLRWQEVNEVGQGLETEARQGDLRMDGAIPLLVVGLELREALRSDRAGTSRWPRGRVVRLERIAVGVMFGAAVLPSMRASPNHRSAVLARTGGTTLPGWIGFGLRA